MPNNASFIATRTGEFINLLGSEDGLWRFIRPQAVVEAMTSLPRFNGHIYDNFFGRCWTVAEHSVFVKIIAKCFFPGLPEVVYQEAVGHDLHEFVVGDITTPMAIAIMERDGNFTDKDHTAIADIKRDVQRAVMRRFGAGDNANFMAANPQYVEIIHLCDSIAFILESSAFRSWHKPVGADLLMAKFQAAFRQLPRAELEIGLAAEWVGSGGDFRFDMTLGQPELIRLFRDDLMLMFPRLRQHPMDEDSLGWDAQLLTLQSQHTTFETFNKIDGRRVEKALETIERFAKMGSLHPAAMVPGA